MTAAIATMSAEEALGVIRRITYGVWEGAPLRRAYLAVSAMAEREAALVKEVEALRARIMAIAEAAKERESARDAFYAADRACGETDDEVDRCVAATKALNDAIDAAREESGHD